MTQNRNLFSMLSPFKKAEKHDGSDANSPEVEARRKLDLRIEQALADQLLALTIEAAPAAESIQYAADFYTPTEHPLSTPSYLDKYSIA